MVERRTHESRMTPLGRPPRLALVGCSWFARAAHLPALDRLSREGLVEVVALCSRSPESLAQARNLAFTSPRCCVG